MWRKILLILWTICLASAEENITRLPTNCDEAVEQNGYEGGLLIRVSSQILIDPVTVQCFGSPPWLHLGPRVVWTVIQRQKWGDKNFNRSYEEYTLGFGNGKTDFFVGLELIHALTQAAENELWVQLEDWNKNKRFAYYDKFSIGSQDQGYAITSLGNYSGDAGDSLRYHVGSKFTTFDKDNDKSPTENCALLYASGWWFNRCIESNLNGLRLEGKYHKEFANGIVWKDWLGYGYSLKSVQMAIRPKKKPIITTN